MKRSQNHFVAAPPSLHWPDHLPTCGGAPGATKERCVDLAIDANLGLLHNPDFQQLRDLGWEAIDIDVTEDRGREIVVRVTLVRE